MNKKKLLPCDDLPVEAPVPPKKKKRYVRARRDARPSTTNQDANQPQSDQDDDDDDDIILSFYQPIQHPTAPSEDSHHFQGDNEIAQTDDD